MHFASCIQVGESMQSPAKYCRNNVVNTLNLLDAMVAHRVRQFVFSSTAAIFGEPERVPIDEPHRCAPVSAYGRTKWMIEQMLEDYGRAYGLRSACLRYFNAAGADPRGRLGERHEPETHLIPLVLRAASGRGPEVRLFGTDYPTPDGSCVRDYVHVLDLCDAHLRALDALEAGARDLRYNLGNGSGFSVRQVIRTVEAVTGRPVPVAEAPRRPGDPAVPVADSRAVPEALAWKPRFPALETIVAHAWNWELRSGA